MSGEEEGKSGDVVSQRLQEGDVSRVQANNRKQTYGDERGKGVGEG